MDPPSAQTSEEESKQGSTSELPIKGGRIPIRLVLCVDGTWIGPDGASPGSEENLSTIFRIWCCVKEGEVLDKDGKKWRQEKLYIRGINDTESWYGRLLSGALGDGIEQQIKSLYKTCCEQTSGPEDEIYFFGFSRGAFVVRAVANLLAYMRVPVLTSDSGSFDEVYKQLLDIYKDVRSGDDRRRGTIYQYMSRTRPPPKIQYIGVVDTVKAFADNELYDISINPFQHHCRQALALNETRVAFKLEPWLVVQKTAEYEVRTQSALHSVIEAWFLGDHSDLGGGNSQDGAALYPAQWLLAEAKQIDLVLDFNPVTYTSTVFQTRDAIENPLEALFPVYGELEPTATPSMVELPNGISVQTWDLSKVHLRKGLDININQRAGQWYSITAAREIFHGDELIGYHNQAALGVIIHPAAYILCDRMPNKAKDDISWSFLEPFQKFRRDVMKDVSPVALDGILAMQDQPDAKFRLLICGNAGVGKSTLINKLFGIPGVTQESESEHGVHDINHGITSPGARYIVHDSCGFQSGQQDEVEKVRDFLLARSSSTEFAERLHAILYCVSSTRLRILESADYDFFKILVDINAGIPIIVIATRIDETEALCSDRIEKSFMLEHPNLSRRRLTTEQWDEIEDKTSIAVEEEKQKVRDSFLRLGHKVSGPVFTSKDNPQSISSVVTAISDSLNDDVIRTMFIAAQTYSIQLKIDAAVANSMRLYTHAVRTAVLPIAFSGLMATTTVTGLIVKDILKIFQLNDESGGGLALRTVSNLLTGNYESNGIYVASNLLSVAATGAVGTGVGAVAGLAMGIGSYGLKLSAVPQFGRLLLMCTVDTILIAELIYWRTLNRKTTAQDIQEACDAYASQIDKVHIEVKNILPVWDVWNAFQTTNLSKDLNTVIDKHRFRIEDSTQMTEQVDLKIE